MTNPPHPLAARMAALNFVLANGEEISDDPADLTALFTAVLLRFEREARPTWPGLTDELRFYLAFDAARFVLSDLLGSLDRRLEPHDRFEWRIKLARMILRYMGEEWDPTESALASLTDYYCLVWNGIQASIEYRGLKLPLDDFAEYAQAGELNYDLPLN